MLSISSTFESIGFAAPPSRHYLPVRYMFVSTKAILDAQKIAFYRKVCWKSFGSAASFRSDFFS